MNFNELNIKYNANMRGYVYVFRKTNTFTLVNMMTSTATSVQ